MCDFAECRKEIFELVRGKNILSNIIVAKSINLLSDNELLLTSITALN